MKAMLLAAGRGERMGALTASTPKPLLEIAGKPLLVHHIERLRDAGFTELVVNTSYLGEQIREFLGDGTRWQVNIRCTDEPERLETAGGIVNALPLLRDEPFLVVNSDVWCDYPLASLRKTFDSLAHLVLVNNPEHNPEGDFVLEADSRLVRDLVHDKASGTGQQAQDALTFSGLSVLSPALFADTAPGKQPLAPLLRAAMAKGQVSGEHYQGTWIDVGTPDRLAQVATLIKAESENSHQRSQSCK